jgi:preprotein translocase subunit YajC
MVARLAGAAPLGVTKSRLKLFRTQFRFPYMSSNPILGSIVMYGAIFAIFYFILIRPQSTQRKKHDELVRNLKKGDEIVTTGGLVGEVLFIKEKGGDDKNAGMEDRVTIKSGDTRVIIERGRIAKINRPGAVSNVTAG